jgi:hypothetical protein
MKTATILAAGLCAVLAGCSVGGTGGGDSRPSFKATFQKPEPNPELDDFLEAHGEEEVRLDLSWREGAFDGGEESGFQFFVLYEDCSEKLEAGEKPNVGSCAGTEYNIPKRGGKSYLVREGGGWRLRGVFTAGEKTGPKQGLFAVVLEPAS